MTANGMTNIDMATKRRYTLADGGRASERGFWRLEHGCKACPKETSGLVGACLLDQWQYN